VNPSFLPVLCHSACCAFSACLSFLLSCHVRFSGRERV
jgi:hypothetical protein